MSRPDRAAQVSVDFSPPRQRRRALPLAVVGVLILAAGALAAAVTQLLLH